jgi:Leucine-rich repeat (LRR) protein
MTGTIPPEVESVSNLMFLSLAGNQISGTLPDIFDRLTNLSELALNNNKIQGPLPKTIGGMSSLGMCLCVSSLGSYDMFCSVWSDCWLGSCFLAYDLLTSVLSFIGHLSLENNAFTGTIPVEYAGLANLETFRIYNTQLAGTMPAEMCDLKEQHNLQFVIVDCLKKITDCQCCDKCY